MSDEYVCGSCRGPNVRVVDSTMPYTVAVCDDCGFEGEPGLTGEDLIAQASERGYKGIKKHLEDVLDE